MEVGLLTFDISVAYFFRELDSLNSILDSSSFHRISTADFNAYVETCLAVSSPIDRLDCSDN